MEHAHFTYIDENKTLIWVNENKGCDTKFVWEFEFYLNRPWQFYMGSYGQLGILFTKVDYRLEI